MVDHDRRSRVTADHVGSLAEELGRLVGAIQERVHDHSAATGDGAEKPQHPGAVRDPGPDQPEATQHGGPECRYCPVCQVVRWARATSPEVREHLTNAALSLTLAVRELLDDTGPERSDSAPIEKIDLAED